MTDYQQLIEDLEALKLTVCFREKTISHPGWSDHWSWGHSGLSYVDAAQLAIRNMRG
ncbi:hypothetical protein D3C80_1158790 [compost metagenome]